MNLDELQSVRDRERQTDKLQQLRETFYADAGEFIQELREQRDRAAERADNPFDAPEVSRLSDEIDTAEGTVEAIYEKRVGKIVKAASFAAADLPAESDGMTAEERELFETLVADIKANREHVLDVIAGEDSPDEDGTARETDVDADANANGGGVSAADAMGRSAPDPADGENETAPVPSVTRDTPVEQPGAGSSAPDGRRDAPEAGGTTPAGDVGSPDSSGTGPGTAGNEPARREGGNVERKTVRITDDVGAIFGVDEREYDLTEDDVVQLPAANAEPLVERGAAERLD